ncbi:MAG: TIGR02452 family protein [Bacteroidales bacterium]|nr:TIGR02452 family protein [Bacteroidales bacterium]
MPGYNNDKRSKLTEIFRDTLDYINEEEDLYDCIEYSKRETEIIKADEYYDLEKPSRAGDIKVTQSKSLEAAMRYAEDEANSEKLIAVLNFASAVNPGGGVERGSSAQEEDICRCSTLFPVLTQPSLAMNFYEPNRKARNPLHTDDIIYSPDIVIIRSDDDAMERLDPEEWCKVDIITCAAPDLRPPRPDRFHPNIKPEPVKISRDELYDLHLSRAQHILNVAAGQGVEILILGAFGCGAFMNDPNVVARAYVDALKEYAQYFDVIEFAVYCTPFDQKNYKAFSDVFAE